MTRYATILADPPWAMSMAGTRSRQKEAVKPSALPYQTMTTEQVCAMDVGSLALPECHLWLWTTNQHLEEGFKVMRAWGFKYLAPIHWIKPSGQGNWFIHRTQTMLFGYRERCVFPSGRYLPNFFESGNPARHSAKPDAQYRFIEGVSTEPRLELFARKRREGWDAWGNECLSVDLPLEAA